MTGAAKPKQPFQWVCWSDYVNHPQLRTCSLAARGLWPDILKVCWEAEPRGVFLINGAPPPLADFAAIVSQPVELVQAALAELEAKGVFSRAPGLNVPAGVAPGTIYCRRMVNDEARKRAQRAKEEAEGEATPTERELVDLAVRQQLDTLAKEEDRKAKQRARTNRSRAKKRAERALEQMRAFEHMAAANARNEAKAVTPPCVTGDVTPPVTVTLQGAPVTLHKSSENNGVTAVSPYLSSIFHLPEDSKPNQQRPAHSPATLTGGERAEREEGQSGPLAMQQRIAAQLGSPRALIQAPNESDEAFALRCAARSAA